MKLSNLKISSHISSSTGTEHSCDSKPKNKKHFTINNKSHIKNDKLVKTDEHVKMGVEWLKHFRGNGKMKRYDNTITQSNKDDYDTTSTNGMGQLNRSTVPVGEPGEQGTIGKSGPQPINQLLSKPECTLTIQSKNHTNFSLPCLRFEPRRYHLGYRQRIQGVQCARFYSGTFGGKLPPNVKNSLSQTFVGHVCSSIKNPVIAVITPVLL